MPFILIIDESLLTRYGLKSLLNEEQRGIVFGEAATIQEARACLKRRLWDLAVVDMAIAKQDGFQLLKEIRQSYPGTRVIVLSTRMSAESALQARQFRVSGYVGKNVPRGDIVKAFSIVLNGPNHFLDSHYDQSAAPSQTWHPPLSARERHVLAAFATGRRIGEIAAELNLSSKTISTYKQRILKKLQLNTNADLVRYAIDNKLAG